MHLVSTKSRPIRIQGAIFRENQNCNLSFNINTELQKKLNSIKQITEAILFDNNSTMTDKRRVKLPGRFASRKKINSLKIGPR